MASVVPSSSWSVAVPTALPVGSSRGPSARASAVASADSRNRRWGRSGFRMSSSPAAARRSRRLPS
ncbi:hypothetical protein ACFFX0_22535 [Citricoccus parietis]|uniref:Uncharacterized protein n=1 Tax=Citricoccus parietis TaxID=592307 RepID=A0ABV5G4G3_9MICC